MNGLGEYQAPKDLERYKAIALGIGGIATLACAVGFYLSPEQALRSWLLGFIFWGGLTIGSIGIIMLQYLTGGAWGVVIRRIVEAASRTLPLVVILFIPLAFIQYYHYWTTWPLDRLRHRSQRMVHDPGKLDPPFGHILCPFRCHHLSAE